MEVTLQATVGKLITGTIVVDMHGEAPDVRTIISRSFCRLIPFDAFSYIGADAIGWHDTISGTRVISKNGTDIKEENNSDVLDEEFS
jgi:uncharacterized RDD family membrane protein YckC